MSEKRESALSNRTILKKIIKEEIDIGEVTDAEKKALDMFRDRLEAFESLCREKFRMERDNTIAKETLSELNGKIVEANEDLLLLEKMAVYKPIIKAAASIMGDLDREDLFAVAMPSKSADTEQPREDKEESFVAFVKYKSNKKTPRKSLAQIVKNKFAACAAFVRKNRKRIIIVSSCIALMAVSVPLALKGYDAIHNKIEENKRIKAEAQELKRLEERAADILNYYDSNIELISENLSFHSSYFTPVEIPEPDYNGVAERYEQQQLEKKNQYGAQYGQEVGEKMVSYIAYSEKLVESFRSNCEKHPNFADFSAVEAESFLNSVMAWSKLLQRDAADMESAIIAYDEVLDDAWCIRIQRAIDTISHVREKMLDICNNLYRLRM